jgi:hypothetical protein
MIPLKVHNVLDYVIGVVLIACPYVFGFADVPAGRDLFLVLGIAIIAYSLATRYPYSIFKWIPVNWHMALDVLLGVVLILGSYIFGYTDQITAWQVALHYVLGVGAIILVAMTESELPSVTGARSVPPEEQRPSGSGRRAA